LENTWKASGQKLDLPMQRTWVGPSESFVFCHLST